MGREGGRRRRRTRRRGEEEEKDELEEEEGRCYRRHSKAKSSACLIYGAVHDLQIGT